MSRLKKKSHKIALAGVVCGLILVLVLAASVVLSDVEMIDGNDGEMVKELINETGTEVDRFNVTDYFRDGGRIPEQGGIVRIGWEYYNLTNCPNGTRIWTDAILTDVEGIQIAGIYARFDRCKLTGDLVLAQGADVVVNATEINGSISVYNSARLVVTNNSFVNRYGIDSLNNVTCHDTSTVILEECDINGIIEAYNTSSITLRSDVEMNGTWLHDSSSLSMTDRANVTIDKFAYANVLLSAFIQDASSVSLVGNVTITDDVMLTQMATANFSHTQFGGVLRSYSDGFGVATNVIRLHKTNHTGLYEEAASVYPNLSILIEGGSQMTAENCSVAHSLWVWGNSTVDLARSTLEQGIFYGASQSHVTGGLIEDTVIGEYPSLGINVALWMTNYADVTLQNCTLTSGITLDDSSDLLVEGTTTVSGELKTTGATLLQLCDSASQTGSVNVTGNSTLVVFSDASTGSVHLETGGLSLEYSDVTRWDAFSDSCRVNISAVDENSAAASSIVRSVEDVCDTYVLSGGSKTTTINLQNEQSGDKTWIWSVYRNPRVGIHYTPVVVENTPVPGKTKPAPRPAEADDEVEEGTPWVRPTSWWERHHWSAAIVALIASTTGLLAYFGGRSQWLINIAEAWDRRYPYRMVREKQRKQIAGQKVTWKRVRVRRAKTLRSKSEIRNRIMAYFIIYGSAIFVLFGILYGTKPAWFLPTFALWDEYLLRLWVALNI